MGVSVGSESGAGGVDVATQGEVDDLSAAVDQINTFIPTEGLRTASDVQWTGAKQQGRNFPPAAATLLPDGSGNDRWVASSVAFDATKRANWAAQGNPVPAYQLPVITSVQTLPTGTNGTAYDGFTFAATSDLGGGDLAWSLIGGQYTDATHVAGLVLDPAAGTLTGTPNTTGTFVFTVEVADELDGEAQQLVTLVIAAALTPTYALPAVPPTQPSVGNAYSYDTSSLAANFTTTPTFSATGFQNHLSINSAGVISGTPTSADYGASFTAQITATDGVHSVTKPITFSIPTGTVTITTTTLPAMQQNVALTPFQLMVVGGTAPYAWAKTAGTLPAGLAVSSTGVLSGTPTGSGAYDVTYGATDSEGTPVTDTQEYTGTIAVAAAPWTFSVPNNGDLTAAAGNPHDGDSVDIDMSQFFSGTPAGAITMDSGSPATLPADGMNINVPTTNHFGGTAKLNKATINPVIRANDTSGWQSVQCHLTVIAKGNYVDLSKFSGITLGDGITTAQGIANVTAIANAIASAASQGYGLNSSQGTSIDGGTPILIGLHKSSFGNNTPYISYNGNKLTIWQLDNVIFYLLGGTGKQQPVGSSPCQIIQITGVSNGAFFLNTDTRGSSQAAPPAAGSGAAGFYNHSIKLFQCDHESGVLNAFNGVGVTGSSSGGTSETFDVWLGQSGGGADLECTIKGNINISGYADTNTAHYCSGCVNQNTVETVDNLAPLAQFKLTVDKRRHMFGLYCGGPSQVMGGSTGSNTARGVYAEDGDPSIAGVGIHSPLLYVGESGSPSNPVVTTNCGNLAGTTGDVGCDSSGGGQVGVLTVYAHTSINSNYGPYTAQNCGNYTIKNSIITGAPNSCIIGQAGGGQSAATNLQAVTVDANSTVAGIGSNAQVKAGGASSVIGHPTSPRTAAAPWQKLS